MTNMESWIYFYGLLLAYIPRLIHSSVFQTTVQLEWANLSIRMAVCQIQHLTSPPREIFSSVITAAAGPGVTTTARGLTMAAETDRGRGIRWGWPPPTPGPGGWCTRWSCSEARPHHVPNQISITPPGSEKVAAGQTWLGKARWKSNVYWTIGAGVMNQSSQYESLTRDTASLRHPACISHRLKSNSFLLSALLLWEASPGHLNCFLSACPQGPESSQFTVCSEWVNLIRLSIFSLLDYLCVLLFMLIFISYLNKFIVPYIAIFAHSWFYCDFNKFFHYRKWVLFTLNTVERKVMMRQNYWPIDWVVGK